MTNPAERCKVKRARWDSGPRTASSIRLVVIHSAEGTSAAGVASFFASLPRERGASTQLAVDDHECWRMLPDLVIPWGAPGANSDGLHIEICGYARWVQADWRGHEPMLRRSAWKVAKWCWQYGIPPRWLSDKQLANGTARGLTTHVQVARVFKRSDHWDPGPGFTDRPKDSKGRPLLGADGSPSPSIADLFLRWTSEYLIAIKAERDR